MHPFHPPAWRDSLTTMADHLTFASATELSRMIRDRSVSSSEVVEAHLRRIEQMNPRLNAVVQVLAEQARRRAREADRATARRESWGPLHGIPVTAKDTIEIRGVPSTGGTMGRADYLPAEDATVIRRLRGAGAIVVGVTNVPELVLAGDTDNLVYGRTNNPYDLSRTPGGSSGGEAAAIAAGLSPLGLGSDVGGSIRLPAHFCGIAGLKPTTGRVPSTGHWPPFAGLLGPMFQIGPMARNVADLALALRLLSGTDGRDPYAVPMPLDLGREKAIDSVRVAYFTDSGGVLPDPYTCSTVEVAAEAVAEAGVSVTEARPPGFEDGHAIEEAVIHADGGATVRRLLEEAGTTETHPLIRWLEDTDDTSALSGRETAALVGRRDRFRRRLVSFLEDYDAILSPAWATAALPHGTVASGWPHTSFTHHYNLSGLPAAVVRAGTSPDRLPIGVQVAAGPWEEEVALMVAGLIEEALGGWRPPP